MVQGCVWMQGYGDYQVWIWVDGVMFSYAFKLFSVLLSVEILFNFWQPNDNGLSLSVNFLKNRILGMS